MMISILNVLMVVFITAAIVVILFLVACFTYVLVQEWKWRKIIDERFDEDGTNKQQ